MAWIESHTALARHPKTIRLAKTLGAPIPQAIGHLHLLWWWALEYAEDGDLSRFDPEEIAAAAMWDGDEGAFVEALRTARFIDPDDRLHDWDDYAGRLIERRAANTERMRKARATRPPSIKETHAQDVQDTCDESVGLPYPTVPDLTGPDRTEPVDTAASAAGRAPERLIVDEIFEHYKLRIQPLARTRADSQIKQRLRHFTLVELKTAVDHFAADEWWMTNNANKGAPWFFKADLRIEQFLNLQERTNGTNRNGATGSHRGPSPPGVHSAGGETERPRRPGERSPAELRATYGAADELRAARAVGVSARPDAEPPDHRHPPGGT